MKKIQYTKMNDSAEKVSELLKVLSHPLRLLAICYLANGEKSVNDICINIGSTQSNVSQHLSKLKSHGIINHRKSGNIVYYRICDKKVLEFVSFLQETYCTE